MLIVEGPDGVGKTTMCRELVNGLTDLGHVYSHFTRLPTGFDRYWGYVSRASPRVVQDRFHMSEVVYAEARGDVTPLCPETYRLVDARLRLVGAFVVLVTADESLVRARWDPSQMFGVEATVGTARAFSDLAGRFPDYRMDVDVRIHCDESHPFPTRREVDGVLAAYRDRFSLVSAVAGRRPPEI